jgi:hypothetical protein
MSETQTPPTRESNVGLFLLGALLLAGLAGGFFYFDLSTHQRGGASESGFNFQSAGQDNSPRGRFGTSSKPAEEPAAAAPPASYSASDSGLGMVRAGPMGAPSGVAAGRPAADPNSFEGQLQMPARDGAPRARPSAPQPPRLSDQDRAALEAVVGTWNEAAAKGLGSDMNQFLNAVQRLSPNPAALKLVLDNDVLIQSVLSQRLVNANCTSAAALKRYYLDGRNGTSQGISRALDVLQASTRYRGATDAILDSRLVKTAASRCPSVPSLTNDPSLIKDIFTKNPKLAAAISNPAIVSPLANNESTRDFMSRVLAAQVGSLGH